MKSEEVNSPDATRTPLDPSRLQRVLLIRLRSIGDTVLMTPCLAALKAWNPGVRIAVVSEPLAAPLLEDHPVVDELIVAKQSVSSRASLIARLRGTAFDVAFNMHGGSTGAILARLSGARSSIGYRGLPMSWMLSDRAPSPDVILGRPRIHSVEQQLALLNWAGVPWPASRPRLSLVVTQQADEGIRERVQPLCGAEGFACIVPGAAFESKRWRAEGFASVADHLSERWNLPSVVVAGPDQEKLASEVASATRSKPLVLSGLSLKELAALLGIARVFVGNDSGPMHMATALERPIVAVWGSSDPDVWRPWTEAPCRVVQASDEMRNDGATGRRGDGARLQHELAIRTIPASEVIAAVDEVLGVALEVNHRPDVATQAQRARIEV